MKWNVLKFRISFIMIMALYATTVFGAPINQSITLSLGWNAVFLEVDPVDPDPAMVFSSLPGLQSVWCWNPGGGNIEFIQNPASLIPESPEWLVYVPGSSEPFLSNLGAIYGGKAYLIQMSGPATLNIQGEPVIPNIDWKPNSFNFVGFHLHEDVGISVSINHSDFFEGSPAHKDQDYYVLDNGNGTWLKNPPISMVRGGAFWVYCQGSSTFQGPINVKPASHDGLHFGKRLDEQELVIGYEGDIATDIDVNIEPNQNNPAPDNTYFHYWEHSDPASASWVTLFNTPLSNTFEPGVYDRIRFGVKRKDLNEAEYSNNLVLTDGTQKVRIPISVTGVSYQGLWSGYAIINRVEEVRRTVDPQNPSDPIPTGSSFSFRLLVHIDAADQVKLLSQVLQLWEDNPGGGDGRYVLLTDDSQLDNYSGIALLDGKSIGRRISSAAFAFRNPEEFSFQDQEGQPVVPGDYKADNWVVSVPLLAKDDALNPFVHKYHPKHFAPEYDNVKEQWSHDDEAMFDINRTITMTPSETDYANEVILSAGTLDWGSRTIGGKYMEVISGLHKQPITIQGIFVLRKISDLAELNPAPL